MIFSSVLTKVTAIKKARECGIVIRTSDIFEKLQKIRHVFFDKTGILTEGSLRLEEVWPESLDLKTKILILDLQSISMHPVAFAIRKAWSQDLSKVSNDWKPTKFKRHFEKLGSGIFAEAENDIFEIKTMDDSTIVTQSGVDVLQNSKSIARLYFNDPIRPESKELIGTLRENFIESWLLTGDKKGRSLRAAHLSGIPLDHVYAEIFPEDKEQIIRKSKNTLMIGDGHIDSLPLASSDVGISVSTSHDNSQGISDITFLRGGLQPLLDLFKIQRMAIAARKRNILILTAYTLVAGLAALTGFMNPILAALLMPVSSGLVIISKYQKFR